MQLDKSKLLVAAAKVGIPSHKVEELWNALGTKAGDVSPRLDLSRVLYYFGTLIVILAMGWFINLSWENFGGKGLLAIALSYMAVFTAIGSALWRKEDLKVPGGLFITMAVCLIPLAVYGFQRWTGWWGAEDPGEYRDFTSWVKGGWFVMEVATVIGGCIALYFYRFPFLTLPIFFSLWFMSMDITPLIFGNSDSDWNHRLWVSIVFGLVLLVVAYLIDQRTTADFAFWGYLFGLIAFWSGLSLLDTDSELTRFAYFFINVFLVLIAVFLERRIFLIFGALGILGYIVSLFYRHFSESMWFPVVLSLIGVLVVFAGILYHKNRYQIESFIFNLWPASLRHWLPRSRK